MGSWLLPQVVAVVNRVVNEGSGDVGAPSNRVGSREDCRTADSALTEIKSIHHLNDNIARSNPLKLAIKIKHFFELFLNQQPF